MELTLHGEDRTFGGDTLFVDLIPSSCWFKNARKNIHPKDWDRVRHHVYSRNNYTCECCKVDTSISTFGRPKIRLDAHERWEYNEETKIQRLVRLVALCEHCHNVTHIGLAGKLGKTDEAKHHLASVTGWSPKVIDDHIDEAFKLWKERNKISWSLDLSLLTSNGIDVRPA